MHYVIIAYSEKRKEAEGIDFNRQHRSDPSPPL